MLGLGGRRAGEARAGTGDGPDADRARKPRRNSVVVGFLKAFYKTKFRIQASTWWGRGPSLHSGCPASDSRSSSGSHAVVWSSVGVAWPPGWVFAPLPGLPDCRSDSPLAGFLGPLTLFGGVFPQVSS